MFIIRQGGESDLEAIAAIQQVSPGAAQWPPRDYLRYEFLVAECGGRIAGFLVTRPLGEGESEILNIAVSPDFRRQGAARALVQSYLTEVRGAVFLEVRASNAAARDLYKSMGFKEFSSRPEYYQSASGVAETAIVMKFHSC